VSRHRRLVDDTWLRQYQPLAKCLAGQTAWVIGGGPSLRNFDPACLAGRAVLVTNEAFSLVPDAVALVFVDVGWFQRRKAAIKRTWRGSYVIGRGPNHKLYASDGVTNVAYRSGLYWSENSRILGGKNSGLAAVNAAWLMGATRAILLGFDMKPTPGPDGRQRNNYHNLHPGPQDRNYTHRYKHLFIPEFEKAAQEMERLGFVVINATPDSALTCFPMRSLQWCLDRYPAKEEAVAC